MATSTEQEIKAEVEAPASVTIKKEGYFGWERQFLPAYTMGILLVSTSKGIMSHHEARTEGLGGVLVGYVY